MIGQHGKVCPKGLSAILAAHMLRLVPRDHGPSVRRQYNEYGSMLACTQIVMHRAPHQAA